MFCLIPRKNTIFVFNALLNLLLILYIIYEKQRPVTKPRIEYSEHSLLPDNHFDLLQDASFGLAYQRKIFQTVNILQYNMMAPVPKDAEQFECITMNESSPPYTVCLHKDEDLSNRLRNHGVWEPGLLSLMKEFSKAYPHSTLLDIGANFGVHTLYAVNMDPTMKAVAVEPFPQNVVLMHKAAHANNVQNQIEVILAAISNERGSVMLTDNKSDFGRNKLVDNDGEYQKKGFITSSIILDDLIPLIKTKSIFFKMDIEGHECRIMSGAHKLFHKFSIPIVVMEIKQTKNQPFSCFEQMLDFFKKRKYRPFLDYNSTLLEDYKNWRNWTSNDMFFLHESWKLV